jgi:outer membrane lipoprotein carrier protein
MKKCIWGLLLLWGTHAWCETTNEALQVKLNAIRTMRASFSQVVRAKQHTVSHSSGTMALSRPGRFRWQTTKPMAQTVIADGHRLWVYDVELEQVTVKKQGSGLGGTVGLFLSGYNDTLARDFEVTRQSKGNQDDFDLRAKSNKANFQRVKLLFVGNALQGIVLFDQLGQQTDVQLSHVKINPTLAPTLFQFKPPKGVDVVNQ